MTTAAMWEARAADGRAGELHAWVLAEAVRALRGSAGLVRTEVFTAPGTGPAPAEGPGRVLLITWWTGAPVAVPDAPAELLGRPVHCWSFTSEYVE